MASRSVGPPAGATPGISLQSLAPIAIFLVVNRLAGLRWAVVAATIWSIKVIIERRRRGIPLGKFMPLITAAVLVRGAIGAITGSETVYFGLGIATKYVAALTMFLSVLLARPLAAAAASALFELPEKVRDHQIFRSTMSQITLIAALYYTMSATFDIWLFRRSSVEGFVLLRFLANWPLSAAAIASILALAQRRLPKVPAFGSFQAFIQNSLADLNNSPLDGPESAAQ